MQRCTVVLRLRIIEAFRRRQVLGKYELYKRLSIHAVTGKKILSGKPVSLEVARRVSEVIKVDVARLIKSWVDDAEQVTSDA